MALPIFHAFGFVFQFVLPFLTSCPVGLYEPKYPAPPVVPTVDNLLEAARLTKCTAMPTIPVFIEVRPSVRSIRLACSYRTRADVGKRPRSSEVLGYARRRCKLHLLLALDYIANMGLRCTPVVRWQRRVETSLLLQASSCCLYMAALSSAAPPWHFTTPASVGT